MRDKAFDIAKNPKYDEYQRGLASMVYTFFGKKKTYEEAIKNEIKNEIMSNKEFSEELHKPIIKIFETRKVHSLFIDNI